MGRRELGPEQRPPAFNPSATQERGWTWSAMDNEWLSKKYPGTVAYLLQIPGGYTTPQF
ncbi:hypothetical protein GXW82_06100 [Streptacidiphilus sp. 4-A2]|nr:hypothetical protein [Streptacidiphilus sp. 4-A2]